MAVGTVATVSACLCGSLLLDDETSALKVNTAESLTAPKLAKTTSNLIGDVGSKTLKNPKATLINSVDPTRLKEELIYPDVLPDDIKMDYKISFEEVYNDFSKDLSGLNELLIDNGKMFAGNIGSLKQLEIGSSIDIDFNGMQWQGKVVKKKPSDRLKGNSYLKIAFGNKGEYMTAYFNGTSTKGKIYKGSESYMYEHNGQSGFIISIYEYKKLNNALHID